MPLLKPPPESHFLPLQQSSFLSISIISLIIQFQLSCPGLSPITFCPACSLRKPPGFPHTWASLSNICSCSHLLCLFSGTGAPVTSSAESLLSLPFLCLSPFGQVSRSPLLFSKGVFCFFFFFNGFLLERLPELYKLYCNFALASLSSPQWCSGSSGVGVF